MSSTYQSHNHALAKWCYIAKQDDELVIQVTELSGRRCMFSDFINTLLSALALAILGKIWKAAGGHRDDNRISRVMSHYTTGALRRRHQKLPFLFYECIGGIITPFHDPKSAHIDMGEVPHELYKKAERLAKVQAKLGRLPNFDFTVKGSKHIYRVCTETDLFRSHTLVFYRRPRLLI